MYTNEMPNKPLYSLFKAIQTNIITNYPPFFIQNDQCQFKRSDIGATDTGFVDIPEGDENALKNASATVGPISVAIDASHFTFQFYHSGVYNEPKCNSEQLDHGVLVVGYGTMEGKDYWIVKNRYIHLEVYVILYFWV